MNQAHGDIIAREQQFFFNTRQRNMNVIVCVHFVLCFFFKAFFYQVFARVRFYVTFAVVVSLLKSRYRFIIYLRCCGVFHNKLLLVNANYI